MHISSAADEKPSVVVRYLVSNDSIMCTKVPPGSVGEACGDYLKIFTDTSHAVCGFALSEWSLIVRADQARRSRMTQPQLDRMQSLTLIECIEMARRCQEALKSEEPEAWLVERMYHQAIEIAHHLTIPPDQWAYPLISKNNARSCVRQKRL